MTIYLQVNLNTMESSVWLSTYLKNYLLGQNQYVDLDSTHSDVQEVHCGVPQGSVMGPLLLNIFINDIIEVNYSRFDFIMYADDTTLISSLKTFGDRKNPKYIENNINTEISKNNFLVKIKYA